MSEFDPAGPLVRRQRRRRRAARPRVGGLSWLVLGLVLGLAGGLFYAWVINPIVYVEASPARFNQASKNEYIFLVSQSYAVNGDLTLARTRLSALGTTDLAGRVGAVLDTYLREGRRAEHVATLARLAGALGVEGTAVAFFAPTPAGLASPVPGSDVTATATPALSPTPTVPPTPTAVPTQAPTSTPRPSPTRPPVYELLGQEPVCELNNPVDQLAVVVLDAAGQPEPGVEVVVTWDGGSDRFYTGFKPARGLGYGDFTMSPDTAYSVVLPAGSPAIGGLALVDCPRETGGLAGGWRLTFRRTGQ